MTQTKEEVFKLVADLSSKKPHVVKTSLQAANLIKRLNWTDEEFEKFVVWWIENFEIIGGSHILQYLEKQ